MYLNTPLCAAIRVRGLYVPPSLNPGFSNVELLTGDDSCGRHDGGLVGHILVGDSNYPSWEANGRDRIGRRGVLVLPDLSQGAVKIGTHASDEFLLQPGGQIFACFVPPGVDWIVEEGEERLSRTGVLSCYRRVKCLYLILQAGFFPAHL